MFVTSHTYAGAGNEVILNSKIKLIFGSVLMFSTVFIFLQVYYGHNPTNVSWVILFSCYSFSIISDLCKAY